MTIWRASRCGLWMTSKLWGKSPVCGNKPQSMWWYFFTTCWPLRAEEVWDGSEFISRGFLAEGSSPGLALYRNAGARLSAAVRSQQTLEGPGLETYSWFLQPGHSDCPKHLASLTTFTKWNGSLHFSLDGDKLRFTCSSLTLVSCSCLLLILLCWTQR